MNNIEKLPKWAQEEIKTLERERDVAVRELNQWVDRQTPSKIYTDELICLGELSGPSFKRRYFQGDSAIFEHLGITLRVLLRDDCLDLTWSDERHNKIRFTPYAYQQVHIEPGN